jgi:hypothetical protein
MQAPDLEPGTWADWANAAATTLGFTIALVLFVIGIRDRRRADEDHRRSDTDRRSQQARKVWAWRAGWTGEQLSAGPPEKHRVTKIHWRIENTSDDPITSCRIYVGPDEYPRLPQPKLAAEVLRAGESAHGELPCDFVHTENLIYYRDPGPRLYLRFMDAAGVDWIRYSDGKLEEIPGYGRPASPSYGRRSRKD